MEEKDNSLNLFKEVKALLKYWKHFCVTLAVCLILSIIYVYVAEPIFQINANVLIKNDEDKQTSSMSSMLQGFSFGASLGLGTSSVDDELLLLNSYSLLRETIKDLNLNIQYKSDKTFSKKDYYRCSPVSIVSVDHIEEEFLGILKFYIDFSGDNVKVKIKKGWSTIARGSGKLPLTLKTEDFGDFVIDKTQYYSEKNNEKLEASFYGLNLMTEIYSKKIEISILDKKANGINLTLEEANIKRGKDLLNTIISQYNADGITDRNISAQRAMEFYDKRIAINKKELDSIEVKIELYKKENNLTDIPSEAQILLDKNGDFKEKLIDSEIQYATVSLIEDFLRDPNNKYALAPFNMGVVEKTAVEGLQQYNDFLLERVKLLKTTSEDNPVIQSLNDQIEIMRDNVLETFKSIKSSFDIARNDLNKQQKTFVERIKKMPTQEREYLALQRQQMIKSQLYLFLLQQKEESSMKLANTMEKAKVVDQAYSLIKPVKPNKMFIISIAILFSFLLMIVFLIKDKLFSE